MAGSVLEIKVVLAKFGGSMGGCPMSVQNEAIQEQRALVLSPSINTAITRHEIEMADEGIKC